MEKQRCQWSVVTTHREAAPEGMANIPNYFPNSERMSFKCSHLQGNRTFPRTSDLFGSAKLWSMWTDHYWNDIIACCSMFDRFHMKILKWYSFLLAAVVIIYKISTHQLLVWHTVFFLSNLDHRRKGNSKLLRDCELWKQWKKIGSKANLSH